MPSVFKNRGGRCVLFSVMVLLIGACFRQKYPADWAPPAPVAHVAPWPACPPLAGRYREGGSTPGASMMSLMEVFREATYELYPQYRHATIAQFGDDSLIVAVIDTGPMADTTARIARERRVLRRADGDYSCSAEGLEVDFWDGVSGEGVLAMLKMRYRIRRALDGALIVQKRESTFGIMLLLPIAGREDRWYRFAPVLPDSSRTEGEAPSVDKRPE